MQREWRALARLWAWLLGGIRAVHVLGMYIGYSFEKAPAATLLGY